MTEGWVVDVELPRGLGTHTTDPQPTKFRALQGARRIAKAWNYGWPTDRIKVRRVVRDGE